MSVILSAPEKSFCVERDGSGISVSCFSHDDISECVVITYHLPGEDFLQPHKRAIDTAARCGGRIISHECFAELMVYEQIEKYSAEVLGKPVWPVSRLVDSNGKPPFTGSCIRLVHNTTVRPVEYQGIIIGSEYEDASAKYLFMGGMTGNCISSSRSEQTEAVFDQMIKGLNNCDMDFSNVLRTWFYNEKILDWYDEFNQVRTAFFNKHQVFDGLVPASTGIGAPNREKAALCAGLIAIQPKIPVKIQAVPSPLQCPAPKYGSSFSRAAEIVTEDYHRLFISGTASIEPGGKTVHLGDMAKQVELTMAVVLAILESRRMNWDNVLHAIVYVREPGDVEEYFEYCRKNNLNLPAIITHSIVCRDNLLFEIEVDAVHILEDS